MSRDRIDLFVEQWNRERPDLDAAPLGVISRILMLYKHLVQGADQALEKHGLTLWQFDVLAALRRSGPPFKLTPTRLAELVTLSAGAMTNRIDRLEAVGLIRRVDHPEDRRGMYIVLTGAGRKLVDAAVVARLDEARANLEQFSAAEREAFASLLRRLLVSQHTRAEDHGGVHESMNKSIKGPRAANGKRRRRAKISV